MGRCYQRHVPGQLLLGRLIKVIFMGMAEDNQINSGALGISSIGQTASGYVYSRFGL